MGLRVAIDEKARQLIIEKGNLITISSVSVENCCVPINEVSIQYSKPENIVMFNEINKDGISFFVDKKLEFKDQLINIEHTGFGPFQTVRVGGLMRF